MSLITNKNVQAEGFHIGSQTPVDDRLIFKDLAGIQDLGAANANVFKYFEGMQVWVVSLAANYVWVESATGLLTTSYTYPAGVSVNGVTYGGRAFNFVKAGIVSANVNLTFVPPVFNLVADVQYTITVPAANAIIGASIFNAANKEITSGLDVEISGTNQLKLTSNIDLNGNTAKITYTTV